MELINDEKIKTTKHGEILDTDGVNMEGNTTDKLQTERDNTTGNLWPSEINLNQSSIEINGTDDISTEIREPSHNSTRRYARQDQLHSIEQVYTLTYWMFSPYNKGKEVCTVNLGAFLGRIFKPRLKGVCHGEEITMGNHVGDWEHVSIQFKVSEG